MAVGHHHTWGAVALVTLMLLSLRADAKKRLSEGDNILVTGPGGESALHANSNQVQIWSCHGGKMKDCRIASAGGAASTPSGRRTPDGSFPKMKFHPRTDVRSAPKKHR